LAAVVEAAVEAEAAEKAATVSQAAEVRRAPPARRPAAHRPGPRRNLWGRPAACRREEKTSTPGRRGERSPPPRSLPTPPRLRPPPSPQPCQVLSHPALCMIFLFS
jgi:hypothetical protein